MKGVKIDLPDSLTELADVLRALEPMLSDFLFWVGDYEFGSWRSFEARAWTLLMFDPEMRVNGIEKVMVSFHNVMYFASNITGLNECEVRLAYKPSDLANNRWAGYIYIGPPFEVGFQESANMDEAVRLLAAAGYSPTLFEPKPLYLAPPPADKKSTLMGRMEGLVTSWKREM